MINTGIARSILNFDNKYSAVMFNRQTFAGTDGIARFYVPGTHVFVAHLTANPVYIKLGPDTNPWIRLRKNDVIVRDFTSFKIRSSSDSSAIVPNISGILYVSNGPFIERKQGHGHFGRDAVCLNSLVATVNWTPLTELVGAGSRNTLKTALSAGLMPTQILLTNRDLIADLYIKMTYNGPSVVAGNTGYRLPPGASITLDLDSIVNDNVDTVGDVPALGTLAGTCVFDCMLQLELDGMMPGSGSGLGI